MPRIKTRRHQELALQPAADSESVMTAPQRPWLGFLNDKVKSVSDHSMNAIRTSIAAGREKSGE
jgi:hypothetical protein